MNKSRPEMTNDKRNDDDPGDNEDVDDDVRKRGGGRKHDDNDDDEGWRTRGVMVAREKRSAGDRWKWRGCEGTKKV